MLQEWLEIYICMSAIVDHLSGVKFLVESAIDPELLNPWTPRDKTLVKGLSVREKGKEKREKKFFSEQKTKAPRQSLSMRPIGYRHLRRYMWQKLTNSGTLSSWKP